MVRTTLLLGVMTGLVLLLGLYMGGQSGLLVAFAIATTMNFVSYWFSDKIVLGMYGAQQVSQAQAPQLYRMVNNLTVGAGMPMPKLYIIPRQGANAFATGRNPRHAAIAVTEGILQLLDEREMTGVLAHELAHIKNRDTLISSVAATMAGVIMIFAAMAQWLSWSTDSQGRKQANLAMMVVAVVAPLASLIIQMAISRTREFAADRTGAAISGDPLGLALALSKLGLASERSPMGASRQTAHFFIVNPLRGRWVDRFFSTHPSLEKRIARLQAMG